MNPYESPQSPESIPQGIIQHVKKDPLKFLVYIGLFWAGLTIVTYSLIMNSFLQPSKRNNPITPSPSTTVPSAPASEP